MNARVNAVEIILKVLVEKRSLAQLFATEIHSQDQALVKELVYGVIRWYFFLQGLASHMLKRPLKPKDTDIHAVILLGLYQLLFTRIPQHAAVYESVKLAKIFKKIWAKPIINAVLQNFLREKNSILAKLQNEDVPYYAHPQWLIDAIKIAWPNDWQKILNANNEKPPLSLRVNFRKITREKYLGILKEHDIPAKAILHTQEGIQLEQAQNINALPYFQEGFVSVQDGAAQLVAELLKLEPGIRVLDACAAPGGKTCHILEKESKLGKLLAIEKDTQRIQKIYQNLTRLDLNAEILCEDVENIDGWWNGESFDRILLDAPCSATGVIRRNPDIKILRQSSDIAKLADQQKKLIHALWPLLNSGGIFLYVTCSILPEENQDIAKSLIEQHPNCVELPMDVSWGTALKIGRQILPGENNMDGFYYARFKKL